MTLYLTILLAFLNRQTWSKYNGYVDYVYIKENYPEVHRLFLCLEMLYKASEIDEVTINDLEVSLHTHYPQTKAGNYTALFETLRNMDTASTTVITYLETAKHRTLATKLAGTALEFSEGRTPLEALASQIEDFKLEVQQPLIGEEKPDYVIATLEELERETFLESGLRWRLGSLNRNLGSLRKGDFGFVFARPETGKTTFLASEATYMAEQASGNVLWINNEEGGKKVLRRAIQASFGVSAIELFANKQRYQKEYDEGVGKRLRIIDEVGISKSRVEELCEKYQPKLILLDQIDKIKGFDSDRLDIELKEIYIWARELAKTYGPVIAVCQAGNTGEGKRWLTMGDVDNSKTGKQGEADFILGIGKVFDEGLEDMRYLHLSKNKLTGDQDAEPTMRHGKWEVRIDADKARYLDF